MYTFARNSNCSIALCDSVLGASGHFSKQSVLGPNEACGVKKPGVYLLPNRSRSIPVSCEDYKFQSLQNTTPVKRRIRWIDGAQRNPSVNDRWIKHLQSSPAVAVRSSQ